MKNVLIGLAIAVGLGTAALTANAAPYAIGGVETLGSSVEKAQWDERYCRRLRRACEFKDERGERGEGNCRRYRRECGRWWR